MTRAKRTCNLNFGLSDAIFLTTVNKIQCTIFLLKYFFRTHTWDSKTLMSSRADSDSVQSRIPVIASVRVCIFF
jgi:hypothetical protein